MRILEMFLGWLWSREPDRVRAPLPPPSRPALYPRTRPALLAVPIKRRVAR